MTFDTPNAHGRAGELGDGEQHACVRRDDRARVLGVGRLRVGIAARDLDRRDQRVDNTACRTRACRSWRARGTARPPCEGLLTMCPRMLRRSLKRAWRAARPVAQTFPA